MNTTNEIQSIDDEGNITVAHNVKTIKVYTPDLLENEITNAQNQIVTWQTKLDELNGFKTARLERNQVAPAEQVMP